MEDKAAQAVRTKRDSTMRVGLKMVREGRAGGVLYRRQHRCSHGLRQDGAGYAREWSGRADDDSATVHHSPSLLLDVGANVDSDPDNLVQFAVMGNIYSRNVLKIHSPRVGLLSIGEEDSKGNSLTRDTLPLMSELKNINFIGNVEGRDLFNGHADVAVCDASWVTSR